MFEQLRERQLIRTGAECEVEQALGAAQMGDRGEYLVGDRACDAANVGGGELVIERVDIGAAGRDRGEAQQDLPLGGAIGAREHRG